MFETSTIFNDLCRLCLWTPCIDFNWYLGTFLLRLASLKTLPYFSDMNSSVSLDVLFSNQCVLDRISLNRQGEQLAWSNETFSYSQLQFPTWLLFIQLQYKVPNQDIFKLLSSVQAIPRWPPEYLYSKLCYFKHPVIRT